MELTGIRGIGEKTEKLFRKLDIESTEDLIRYYPVHYEEYRETVAIGAAVPGEQCSAEGIISGNVGIFSARKMKLVSTVIQDPTGKMRLTWFNMPYLRGRLTKGSRFIFHGLVQIRRGARVMEHPEIFTPEAYAEKVRTLSPVYGLTKGLSNGTVSKAVRAALDAMPPVNEYLPEQIVKLNGLIDENDAVRIIHFPKDASELQAARKRLVFDEFFLFILAMRKLKDRNAHTVNAYPMKETWETEKIIERLPYTLTNAQTQVWHQIEHDLAGKRIMSRLVQGDVGSGKTILAFLAMAMTASNGFQSALMAPTEVLARQHFRHLQEMAENGIIPNLHPVLLTGSMKASERKKALEAIRSGSADAVIGTHALIQAGVEYHALALVITDEQHRFGVHQRKAFSEKGEVPNAMVMSATPIPRTLGVIYFGDLDISILDEMPKERLRIKSCVVDASYRPTALKFIRREVEAGHQAYIICPMIEEADGLAAENVTEYGRSLKKEMPDLSVDILHGRMKPEAKDRVMEKFLDGTTQILVSTTVIEVGVDVPNATVMLIENAERFGLAELHQLRGRVGRGSAQSYCIFMAGISNDEIKNRLEILNHSSDGFEIARKDFELRGPGDLLGIRQSGDAAFRIADVFRDEEILRIAGETAASVMQDDPGLLDEEHELLSETLDAYLVKNEKNVVL
jgi:ATP-dependent DNA helicase RecG